MAVLSKQGEELWRFEMLTQTLSYRSNGVKMINYGSGWKIKSRKKKEVTTEQWCEWVEELKVKQATIANSKPWFERFKKNFHNMVPLKHRSMVYENARLLLPSDPDALYATIDDYVPGLLTFSDCEQMEKDWRMVVVEKRDWVNPLEKKEVVS